MVGLLVVSAVALAPISKATPQASSATTKATNSSTAKRGRAEFVPGEALVRFKKDKGFEGSSYMAVPNESRGGQTAAAPQEKILVRVDRFEGSKLVDGLRIAYTSAPDTWKAIAALRARSDVLYAEPNYIVHADNTPNDPNFPQLYGMTKIAGPQAWDITTGSSTSTSAVVGVIDEGIQITHPDLQANIWTNPAPGSIAGISGDVNGYDFINNSGAIPVEGHATHVAGTIGAVGNNGIGVVGVNWQTRLMSLRFIDEATNNGSTADAIRACTYAKQMKDLWTSSGGVSGANVRVLNNSWGGGGFEQSLLDAINAVGQSGILFVAAAGNESTNNDLSPHYPSSYVAPNVISVTGTDSSDGQAYNFGLHSVLMGAPGVNIYSTYPPSTYAFLSGTSMATPHVSGAAALLLAANPNLTVNQLRALLAYNGDVLPSLQGKTVTGRRLNVFKSLQALNENDTTPPGTVGSFQITSQTGRAINLSWVASGDDGSTGQASLYDISFIDGFNNAVIPMTTVVPATTGTLQTTSVSIPYRHTSGTIRLREFDNVGNEGAPITIPVSVDPFLADPYSANTAAHEALSTGGTPLGLTQDDAYISAYSLPFSFPFFGQTSSTVRISTNGALYFSTRTDNDSQSSIGGLSQFRMIAGMWDDLDLRTCYRSDADIYVVQPDSNRIIFRWQGVPFIDTVCPASPLTDPNAFINFEVELDSNGTVKTRYGSGNMSSSNASLFPVVGISGGEPDTYVIGVLTSDRSSGVPINLTNAQNGVYTPRTNGLRIEKTSALAGRTSGGQQVILTGGFAGLSTVTMGGSSASWFYTNGAGDTSMITVTTPAHAVGAAQIDLTPTSGSVYSKTNAFAYLPTVFTDDTIVVGQTTAKAQHIIELRQAVDAIRAVAGLGAAPWTDPALAAGNTIRAVHIAELRTFLNDAASRLGFATSGYTDPGLTTGFVIKRIHIEELRQRIRTIAG